MKNIKIPFSIKFFITLLLSLLTIILIVSYNINYIYFLISIFLFLWIVTFFKNPIKYFYITFILTLLFIVAIVWFSILFFVEWWFKLSFRWDILISLIVIDLYTFFVIYKFILYKKWLINE